MINPQNICDKMPLSEYSFKKYKPFTEHLLPLTKNNEQYLLIEQPEVEYNIIQYIIIL